MDYQVAWSPEALDDVDAIAEYIAKDSPFYAQSIVERLLASSKKLTTMPLRGRVVPELKDESYRECFVSSYRMIYHIEDDSVVIAAVIHGARLLKNADRFDELDS